MNETVQQDQDNPQPKAGGESASGTTDLDTLTAEFDAATKSQPATPKPATRDPGVAETLKALKPVIDFVKNEQTTRVTQAHEQDLEKAFTFMREPEEFKDFPKKWLIGYFEAYGGENKDFTEAFEKRHEAPQGWQAELEKAREAFPDWLKELPGNTVRSDVEAATAAVNGTTEEAAEPETPSPVEMQSMSDTHWKRFMAEQRRLAAG